MLQQAHMWTKANHDKAVAMWRDGASVTEVAAHFSISRSAVSGYISRNRDVFATRRQGQPVAPKPRTGVQHAVWTEDRIALVEQLCADGHTSSEIAEELGVTPGAVRALWTRQRERFGRKRKGRPNGAPTVEKVEKIDLGGVFEEAPSASPYDGRRFILSGHEPVPFASLSLAQCRFPVGAPDDQPGPAMACCGAERAFGQYCAAHYAVAHRRPE